MGAGASACRRGAGTGAGEGGGTHWVEDIAVVR